MKTLQEALDSIAILDSAHLGEPDFVDLIAKKMPGWAIEVWDMDEYGNGLTQSVVSVIAEEVKEGRTEIQYGEWCTGVCDAYYAVVTTRKPKE